MQPFFASLLFSSHTSPSLPPYVLPIPAPLTPAPLLSSFLIPLFPLFLLPHHRLSPSPELYNPYFGSIFRAYENPTYFARRLGRFADIYMSSVVNLLDYPIDYSFYVR